MDFNYCSLKKVKLPGQFREAVGKIWSDIILNTKQGVICLVFHWQWSRPNFGNTVSEQEQIKVKLDFSLD